MIYKMFRLDAQNQGDQLQPKLGSETSVEKIRGFDSRLRFSWIPGESPSASLSRSAVRITTRPRLWHHSTRKRRGERAPALIESDFVFKTDQPLVNTPYSDLLACRNKFSNSVKSPTAIALRISRSMSISSSCSTSNRMLCTLTAAAVSERGITRFLPVVDVVDFLVFRRRLPTRPNDALIVLTTVGLMVPPNPAACHALFTAATLPWGLS
jgi:hypothetical protein